MQRHLPSGDVNLPDGQLRVTNEKVLHRGLRTYLKHVAIVLVVVCLLGFCYAAGRRGATTKQHDSTPLRYMLSARALLGGPIRLDNTVLRFTRLGQQSAKQLKSCMEACLQSTSLTQLSSWFPRILLTLIPWGSLHSAGSGIAAVLQSVETGKLVVTLAIFATLTAAMANTIAKHRHYLFMQRPSRGIARCAKWNAHCTAESAAQPQTNPLTLAELLEHADQDGADRMVILVLAAPRLTWNSACGLTACLTKAWRVLTAINFSSVKTLVSTVLRPCSFLATCRLQAVSSITSLGFWIMKKLPGAAGGLRPNKAQLQEAQAALHQTTVVLDQMNQAHVQMVAELQETKVNKSSWINSLRAKLAVNTETTDAACQQSRLDAQAANVLEQQLQQAKEAKMRSHRRVSVLANMLNFTHRESNQTEERLTNAQILISGLEKSLTHAQQDRDANAVSRAMCDALSAQLAEALSAKAAAEAQLEQLQDTVNCMTGQLAYAVSSQIAADAQAKRENAELSFQTKMALARRDTLQQQVQQLKSEKADLSRQLADALAGQAVTHTQVQQLQASNRDLAAELADAVSGKAAAEQHVQQLQEHSEHVSAELADAVSSKAAAEQQLHCATAHNKDLTAQLAEAMSDKAAAAKDAQCIVSDRRSLYTQLADAIAYLAGTAEELKQVKADRESMSEKLAATVASQQDSEKCLSDYKGQLVNLQKQLAASEQEVVKCAGDHEQLSDAHVLLKGKLAAQKLRLEEVQQRRKHDKVKLQVQGDKVAKWQGEVRRLTNVVLHNNINSGKFFEACATVRSQRSGKVDPDLAAAAKALQAAAKAGRPFSSHTKANPVGISAAGKQPVSKPKSVTKTALSPDNETMPLQELRSASNPPSFGAPLLLKPSIKPCSNSDTASSHPAAVKAAKGGAVHGRYPSTEVDNLDFEDSKENSSLMPLSRSTGHMKGSSSDSPPAFSKAEAASMIATLRSRSAGCTSAGQAHSSKTSSASSSRRAFSPWQTGTSRATISPLPAIKGQLRGQSKAAPAPPQAATGITLSHPPFTFASPAPHSLQYGHRAGSQPGQFAENPCRVQLTPPDKPASPLQSSAPFVMTAEPASNLCSYPAASAIRQLRATRTAASQLSLSCAAGILLPSAGSTVEAAHMAAAAASQSLFAETPAPLSGEAAAADAATAWADQVIDDVGSLGRATTDVAEPALLDVAILLQCAALQEEADAPRCNSPAFGTDQQQCDSASSEEACTDGAITPEHKFAVSAVFTDEPRHASATAEGSALLSSSRPASPSAASEASCDSGLSACLDAALADSPNSSVGTQASAEHSLTRSDPGAQSPAAPSSPCSSGHVREADQGTALRAGSSSALLEAALDRQTFASHSSASLLTPAGQAPDAFSLSSHHLGQLGSICGSDSGPVFSSPAVARDQIPNSSWVLDSVLDGHDANVMFAPPQSQAVASACQAEVLSPSFDLDFLTNADLVRLDAHTLQHDAASITAKFEDSLHLLQPCSEMHGLQRAHSARPHACLHSSFDDTAGHVSVAAEGISFMDESRITGLQQQQQPGFPSALYQSSQSYSVTSEDSPLASSGQGTSDDAPTTAHAWAPLGPDNSSEAAEGVKDLGASMHGTLSHLTFLDMEGILLGESP